jgi:hypothetical protein
MGRVQDRLSKTCKFYKVLQKRSQEAKGHPEALVPLEDA